MPSEDSGGRGVTERRDSERRNDGDEEPRRKWVMVR